MSINQIRQLVEKYELERDHYLSATYNETQLRMDFLDPFFEALGWDINNTKKKPTYEREVILEESLKHESDLNSKKPDYTFRLFGERKFFVEAKKPSVKIDQVNDPAKQVRRYGFTARLKVSVLSNFEYLAIYDCSKKVEETDLCNNSRIKIYHYSQYVAAFEDLQKEIGFESVYTGDFDEHWKDIEDRLRLFSVDKLFLSQINEWRLLLGREIYSHNPSYSETLLNDIVQKYLNSIIFLRVCEDRNLEEYKTLLNIADNGDHAKLINRFREADKKYNSGLFNHELVSDIITNNHSAFWKIIKQLYYPESTYSFSVFSSDILGNIYEVFLGEQLKINNGSVDLQKKPDHIDRDIITTPTFIVKSILSQTVLEYCKGKTDEEILSCSFADIACGSGVFLLETYQLINDILIDYYLANKPENLIQIGRNTFKLPFQLKRRILESCLFGVDKDYSAVEACKFGLLLKLLEDEDNNIPAHALPDLGEVIHFGNSLISPSLTNSSNRETINPFDFGNRKFDVIVGNPPYMSAEDMKKITALEYPIYKNEYKTVHKQYDKYFLFVERSLNLLKENGYFGYIIPSKFTKVGSGEKIRALLKESACIKRYISFGANQLFLPKTTYTCILILQNKAQENFEYIEVMDLKDWSINGNSDITAIPTAELSDEVWIMVTDQLKPIYNEIKCKSILLGDLVGEENIFNGIQTSANDVYIHTSTSEDDEYVYFTKDGRSFKIEKILTRPYFKSSSGDDNLNTYRALRANSFVIYPYLARGNGEIEFVDINRLESEYPSAYNYLMDYKHKLDRTDRDIKPTPETPHEWYRYGRHQSLSSCDVPAKIIVGVLSQGNKYAIDYNRTLISSGGTAGYCMITLPDDLEYSIYYIQALLNSKYGEWFASLIGEIFRGGYIARGTKILKKLPIRKIDFTNENDKSLHDRISLLQKGLIEVQGEIDSASGDDRRKSTLKRLFDQKKEELDSLLCELFGLGNKDSKIPLISDIYEANT